jgi:hypothetical protein
MKDLIEMANFLLVKSSGFNIRELVKSVMAVSYTNRSGDDSHDMVLLTFPPQVQNT